MKRKSNFKIASDHAATTWILTFIVFSFVSKTIATFLGAEELLLLMFSSTGEIIMLILRGIVIALMVVSSAHILNKKYLIEQKDKIIYQSVGIFFILLFVIPLFLSSILFGSIVISLPTIETFIMTFIFYISSKKFIKNTNQETLSQ